MFPQNNSRYALQYDATSGDKLAWSGVYTSRYCGVETGRVGEMPCLPFPRSSPPVMWGRTNALPGFVMGWESLSRRHTSWRLSLQMTMRGWQLTLTLFERRLSHIHLNPHSLLTTYGWRVYKRWIKKQNVTVACKCSSGQLIANPVTSAVLLLHLLLAYVAVTAPAAGLCSC